MSHIIPIFDSLTHPTLDGNWILPKYPGCAYIADMLDGMKKSNICGAFAVGMNGIGKYDEDEYLSLIRKCGRGMLFPIAFFTILHENEKSIRQRLAEIKANGYSGIKLHSRIGDFLLSDPLLPYAIDVANELGLIVMLCTYFYSNCQSYADNNIEKLGDMLVRVNPASKVILLHGGSVRLLEGMEIVRAFPNTLLDLSMTICKYDGSSLDMDIHYMFRKFDRRVCVGTDYPEASHEQLRERFNLFAANTTIEKAENIAYKNILSFAGISANGLIQ